MSILSRGHLWVSSQKIAPFKSVEITGDIAPFATCKLQVNAKEIGPKLGSKMKDVLRVTREGGWKRLPGEEIEAAGVILSKGDYEIILVPHEGKATQALPSNDAVVVLDVVVTPELEEEGVARDLVRLVQQARKEAGFHVSDEILLTMTAPDSLQAIVKKHQSYIADQILAKGFSFAPTGKEHFTQKTELSGQEITLSLERCY